MKKFDEFLILEQSQKPCPNGNCWVGYGRGKFWNGEGKYLGVPIPKIEITRSDTEFKITYQGVIGGLVLLSSENNP